VEIRENSADDKTIGRFDETGGLLDVNPAGTVMYHLAGYSAGARHDLASEKVNGDAFLRFEVTRGIPESAIKTLALFLKTVRKSTNLREAGRVFLRRHNPIGSVRPLQ
jgi:hypothetical protein